MKKIWKRVLSVALCAVLVFGVLSTSSLAADEDANLAYQCYTYLGDSISWGYGLDPNMDNHDKFNVGARVTGSFTDLVACVLEQNTGAVIHPAASSGARICDYRILLERGMGVETPYDRVNDWYGNRHPERTEMLRNMGPQICDWLGESDLVTVQAGINDLTAALVNAACATGLVDLDRIQQIKDLDSVLEYLMMALHNVAQSPDVLGNLVRTFTREISDIRRNVREVVKDVVALTPENADILLVGYHKAAQSIRVLPGTDFSLVVELINAALVSLNDYFADVASEYGNVYFVNAPNASTFFQPGTMVTDALKDIKTVLWGIHPDHAGHAYIARRVLDKLDELNVCHHTHTKTVCETVKLPCGTEIRSAEVCADCGRVLSVGEVSTPVGDISVPAYTIDNIVTTTNTILYKTLDRLTFGLLSKRP